MKKLGTFPFGEPILPVSQRDRRAKGVFVLGVYASAVHARWFGSEGKLRISALAVASEPEMFWCGDKADQWVREVSLPPKAGRLEPASFRFNGPSGRALNDRFLSPLKLNRSDVWLCDLVPYSCMNESQKQALKRYYLPDMKKLGLPEPRWPTLKERQIDEKRLLEIESEIRESKASVLITLGDQPLRWFTRRFGLEGRLAAYGRSVVEYGRLHPLRMGDRELLLLPLVHPRQAGKLGSHSSDWSALHEHWRLEVAPRLLRRA